jgi:hypothetical protein
MTTTTRDIDLTCSLMAQTAGQLEAVEIDFDKDT